MKLTTLTTIFVLLLLTASVPAEAGKGGKGGGSGTPTPSGFTGLLYFHRDGTMDSTAPSAAPPLGPSSPVLSPTTWTGSAVDFGSQGVSVTWWGLATQDVKRNGNCLLRALCIGEPTGQVADFYWIVSLYQTPAGSSETLLARGSDYGTLEAAEMHTVSLGTLTTTGSATLRVEISRAPLWNTWMHFPGALQVLQDSESFPSCISIAAGAC